MADALAEQDNETALADDLRSSIADVQASLDAGISGDDVEHVDIAISGESTAQPVAQAPADGAGVVDSAGDAAPPPAQSAVLERLRQHGLDVPASDDTAIADYVASQIREAHQLRAWVEQSRQQIAQWQQWAAHQQQAQQQAPAEQPKAWNPPKLDPSWQQYRELGEDGKLRWNAETPEEIKHQWAAYQAYRQDFANKLIDDPMSALEPLLKEREAQLLQQLEQRQAQQAQQQRNNYAVQSWINQNSSWMYQHGPNGQPLIGPNGQYVTTPQAARAWQYIQEMAQYVPPEKLDSALHLIAESAKQRVINEMLTPMFLQQQQAPPAEQAAQADLNLLKNGAKRNANRGNSVRNGTGAAAPLQNDHASFGDIMRAELEATGLDMSRWN